MTRGRSACLRPHVPVPSELRTAHLLLRPWRPDDAARLLPVHEENHAHLAPWIPARVADPAPLPALEQRLAEFAADFAAAREWRYAMLAPDGDAVLGEVGLYPRAAAGRVPYADADHVEIGYWLRADATGRGLASEATRAALDVAVALPRLARAEIRCDVRNAASAAVPRRLGFVLDRTIQVAALAPAEPPIALQVWTHPLHRASLDA